MHLAESPYNLYHAAKTGCVETVNLLLEYGAVIDYGSANIFKKGCLLHGAVQSRCTEMIECILALGVDVNELDDLDRTITFYGTPLHRAVASTHDLDAVKLLLAHGASINLPSSLGSGSRGKTVLDLVMEDEIEEHIPKAIKDLVKDAALGRGMAPRT
jgi:ankyrin repeat protein